MEQGNVYDQWDIRNTFLQQTQSARETPISLFICPTRGYRLYRGSAQDAGCVTDYAANAGTKNFAEWDLDGCRRDRPEAPLDANGMFIVATGVVFEGNPGASRLLNWRERVTMASVIDGTSNTLLFGEKHLLREELELEGIDSPVFNGDHHRAIARCAGITGEYEPVNLDLAKSLRDMVGPLSRPDMRYQRIFGSWHSGVCNFVLVDGSTRSLHVHLEVATLHKLASRNDGLPVSWE
jgi:hypothetical protein